MEQHQGAAVRRFAVSESALTADEPSARRHLLRFRDITDYLSAREAEHRRERFEALGRLGGGVAHDINNLLGTMLAASDFVRAAEARGDHEAVTSDLDALDDAIGRASLLVERVLSYTEVGSGAVGRCALDHVVRSASELLGRHLPDRFTVSTELGAPDEVVLLEAAALERVIVNLATNARDAMPHGGRVALRTRRVDARWIELEVEDAGIGMGATVLEHLFEPYFTTKGDGGNGLGLTVVYGAVARAGGRIDVHSAPGRGARFVIRLPRVARVDEATAPFIGRTRPLNGPILVVDDRGDLRRGVARMLEESGFAVLEASSSGEASDVASRVKIGLLVTDVLMPDGNGLALARTLREDHSELPVLFMTGYLGALEVEEVARESWARVLRKLFDRATLLRHLPPPRPAARPAG